MTELTQFTLWYAILGVLLIGMTLGGSMLARMPASAPMLYVAVGYGISPAGLGLIDLDPIRDAPMLERVTEIALLISLFTAGMKLELPLKDRRWMAPVRLASVSMLITVGGIALVAHYVMHMPWGAGVLLAVILAPTDPVLASDVQVTDPGDRDRLRFSLTGEGGLNDGTAFPLILLGLGMLGLHDLGDRGWIWWTVDVVWAVAGGLALGALLGTAVGRIVIYLRTRHREALGADEFIAFGLIALTYGLALWTHTGGFLAVFAAGLALRRIDDRSHAPHRPTAQARAKPLVTPEQQEAAAVPPADAPANMMLAVQRFNSQLERFAEVGIVLVIGALLAVVPLRGEVLWLIPLLFLVIRPASVYAGLAGTGIVGAQRGLMAWFGIRGIGSIYYLMFAINHGLDRPTAARLISLTLAVVLASIIAHGLSVTPLMMRYEAGKARVRNRLSARRGRS